jgi:hypothetical protein
VLGHRGRSAATAVTKNLFSSPHIIFRSLDPGADYQRIAYLPVGQPRAHRRVASQRCLRVAAAARQAVCLRASLNPTKPYDVVSLNDRLEPVGDQSLGGIPSRARVSSDGGRWATTVFVSGHSYTSISFSTETILHDRDGKTSRNLENYAFILRGARDNAADRNVWGVTFAGDPAKFFATVATGGLTYLARGDVHAQTLTAIRENAECPSLSPDGRTIVYKKLVDPSVPGVWRFYALDIASGRETVLGERRSVDDQVAWLDNQHIMYAIQGVKAAHPSADIWVAPIDGGRPRLLIHNADSPTVIGRH